MADEIQTRVVLKQKVLRGSDQPESLQRVAIVYIDGREYRISAPPEARGEALAWIPHFVVRQLIDFNSEIEIHDAYGRLAIKAVQDELEKGRGGDGMHPDGLHCAVQICLAGHVQHYNGTPFDLNGHCTKCGTRVIAECSRCGEPIRGVEKYKSKTGYDRPRFCHKCGYPYQWMEDRLRTARELLEHDDQLSLEDRNSLWDDLRFVMSDPKADLVPAKKKLIDIKLGKASAYVKDALLDLIAKTMAEVLKG